MKPVATAAMPTAPTPAQCAAAVEACACFNIRRTARVVTQVYDEALAGVGVSSGQFVVLLTTRILGGGTLQELAVAMSLERSALSRALQPLLRRKLLEMKVGRDRRTRQIDLTEGGLQLLTNGVAYWGEAQQRMNSALGSSGFEALLQISRQSFDNLVKETSSGQ